MSKRFVFKRRKNYVEQYRKQAAVLLFLTSFLVANVFGFHYWAVEPPNKKELLKVGDSYALHTTTVSQMKEIVWAEKFTSNFLVLGQKEGDVGTFIYGRPQYILMHIKLEYIRTCAIGRLHFCQFLFLRFYHLSCSVQNRKAIGNLLKEN